MLANRHSIMCLAYCRAVDPRHRNFQNDIFLGTMHPSRLQTVASLVTPTW